MSNLGLGGVGYRERYNARGRLVTQNDDSWEGTMKLPHRRQFLHLAVGAAALSAVPQIAWAQVYPSRPITVVVPFAPGGATEVIARSLAERMRITLGQSIIVENATGAGGTVGVGRVVRSIPDGYTLSIGKAAGIKGE
jgi:tripartite-type tricarboxylate transporter receptor subunit TctC